MKKHLQKARPIKFDPFAFDNAEFAETQAGPSPRLVCNLSCFHRRTAPGLPFLVESWGGLFLLTSDSSSYKFWQIGQDKSEIEEVLEYSRNDRYQEALLTALVFSVVWSLLLVRH